MSAKMFLAILISLFLISPSLTKSIPTSLLRHKPGGFGALAKNKHVNNLVNFIENVIDGVAQNWIEKNVNQHNGGSSQTSKPVTSRSSGVYEIDFAIGNQSVSGVVDITSGLIWTQCKTCAPCFNQSTSLYDPKKSSTFSNFTSLRCNTTSFRDSSVCQIIEPDLCSYGCEYVAYYSDDQNSTGYVGTDTFTFGSSAEVNDILFGCGTNNYGDYDNASGVFALGKGPLSFVSQLGYMRFSYCLYSDAIKESPINFGSYAKLHGSGQHTKLVTNENLTDLYYIGLVDVTVGKTRLNIPSSTFALKTDGSGGMVLSTAFPVTYLEQAGYDLVRKAFVSQINMKTVNGSYLGLDLCFQSVNNWPLLTLHFDGSASLALNSWNYMTNDSTNGIQCLTILPSSGMSVLGSLIQMDTNFVFDIENSTISFEKCSGSSSLPAHLAKVMVIFLFMIPLF